MAQFHVYRNLNTASKAATPYLLDVQSDLLSELATRVVVPLRLLSHYSGSPMKALTPCFQIEGHDVIALTQQLAAISAKEIGAPVTDLSGQHAEIIAALDFLVSGF
jgi:toxin CcdB